MHFQTIIRFVTIGLLLVLTSSVTAQPGRDPIPSDTAQAQAEKELRFLLGGKLSPANAEEAQAVALELAALSEQTSGESAARFVLLRFAREIALETGEPALVLQMIDRTARQFAIDELVAKIAVIRTLLERGALDDSPHFVPIDEALQQVRRDAIRLDREDIVHDVADLLATLSGRGLEVSVTPSIPTEVEAKAAALRVAEKPGDAEANRIVGLYLCFARDAWLAGIAHLAKGDDPALRRIAELEQFGWKGRADLLVGAADGWRLIAQSAPESTRHIVMARAEALYRSAYPELTGLARLRVEKKMRSKPLLVFDADVGMQRNMIEECFAFAGNHGRVGPGSWADYQLVDGTWQLVANRAGTVTTIEQFPSEGVTRWQVDAEIWSDLLTGTAFEFAGWRMYFGNAGGVHFEHGWIPPVTHPITADRYHHYLIDISPGEIALTIDGEALGAMTVDQALSPAPIVLRGWEGHVRCKRLVVWALPEETSMPQVLLDAKPESSVRSLPYPEFKRDVELLRRTNPLTGVGINASSPEAMEAAVRVFEAFPSIGMTRERVLEVLGDPATISDYGRAAADEPDAPLAYLFDSGFGGPVFVVRFRDGLVSRVDRGSLN